MAESMPPAAPPRRVRRLPAVLRWLVAVLLGAGVAALASYLLRSIGF